MGCPTWFCLDSAAGWSTGVKDLISLDLLLTWRTKYSPVTLKFSQHKPCLQLVSLGFWKFVYLDCSPLGMFWFAFQKGRIQVPCAELGCSWFPCSGLLPHSISPVLLSLWAGTYYHSLSFLALKEERQEAMDWVFTTYPKLSKFGARRIESCSTSHALLLAEMLAEDMYFYNCWRAGPRKARIPGMVWGTMCSNMYVSTGVATVFQKNQDKVWITQFK